MKVRNLAVLATVAIGATALAAPAAFAADAQSSTSKAQKRTNADIKRLGENVRDLRKKDDETNGRIDSITAGLRPVLNQLGDAAKSYANFQYGFVQLTIAGVGGPPTLFTVTPRLDPTMQQSTVSRQFVMPTLPTALTLGAEVGVRSLNKPSELNNESTPFCTFTATTSANQFLTSKGNPLFDGKKAAGFPFWAIDRSTLVPKDPADELFSIVNAVTGDKTVNLLDLDRASGVGATGPNTAIKVSTGDRVTVSLSCTAIGNADLKDNGITPPFAS